MTANNLEYDAQQITVPIGKSGDALPADIVSTVLGLMREHHGPLLSALIGEAYTGEIPSRQRGRTGN